MARVYRIEKAEDRDLFAGASCAFGVFDGVHIGHRFLLRQAQETAQARGIRSVAITFDIDPDERFHAHRLKKLLSNEDRIAMLAASGVDAVAILPFTPEFSSSAPGEFLATTFSGHAPACLHVGNDFRFGKKAAGTVADLERWGHEANVRICAHDLVSADGRPITATRIRLLLADGKVREAAELLSYPYTLHDRVVAGRGEGADMGFATANLVVEPMRRVLGEGVYGAYAVVDGIRHRAAVSVGVSPTFGGATDAYSEVHILDFAEDIYHQDIYVEFVEWLRPMMEFASVDELVATVMGNIQWVRDNLEL